MTLCVAWRWQDNISLASDSCITADGGYAQTLGVKIVSIPVRIISSIEKETGRFEERFKATYGLAFSGAFTAAYVIREMLSEVLSHLQSIGSKQDMAIERIMDIVHRFHLYYTRELRSSLRDRYDLDFFLGGRCPATDRVKIFKFVSSESESATYKEVLQTLPFSYEAIGAGDDRFRARLEADLANPPCRVNFAVFRRLRDVIRDPTIPTVDGRIQAGAFENGEFSLYGMFEFDLSGEQPRALQSIRGLVLDEVYKPEDSLDLHLTYSFVAPFQSDLDQLTG